MNVNDDFKLIIKYALVGFFILFLQFYLFNFLNNKNFQNYIMNNIFVSIVGIILSYLLMKFFVFKYKNKENVRYHFIKYSITYILAILINTTALYFFVETRLININLCFIFASLISIAFTSICNFFIIWKKIKSNIIFEEQRT